MATWSTELTHADDNIDFDNTYDEPKIELERTVRRVEVTYWSDLSTSALSSVDASDVNIGDTLKLEGNTLINDPGVAADVAEWIMVQKLLRAKYGITWRGNPAHELGDAIAIENSYGGDKGALVTRTEWTYQGYLQGRTEAKGAVS